MQVLGIAALIIFVLGLWVIVKYGIKAHHWVIRKLAPYNRRAIREKAQVQNTIQALVKANFYASYPRTMIITSSIASSELALLMEMNPDLLKHLLIQGISTVTTRELVKRFIDQGAQPEVISYLMQKNGFNHYLINKNNGAMALIGYC